MKLSQLEQILEVAKVGSISQAAKNLYMAQSNLSTSIRQAEKELGVVLFVRNNIGVTLTSHGLEFVDRAKDIMQQLVALESAFSDESPASELHIASISYRIVNIEIAKIIQKYEDKLVVIDLIDAVGTRLLDMVAEGRAEIGFCTVYEFTKAVMMRQIASRKLEYYSLGQTQAGIYIGKKNHEDPGPNAIVDFKRIQKMPMILIAKREFNTDTIIKYLRNKGISLDCKRTILVSNFGELRNILNLVDSFAIASYIDLSYGDIGFYDDLYFIPFEKGLVSAEVGFVQIKQHVRTPIADELITALREDFSVLADESE